MSSELPEARILVVDDEQMIVELLAISLRVQGFEVATAVSGAEALARARSFRPDALILDVMIPDIDGFTVLRRLREDGVTAPVLFLTARDEIATKLTGLTVGGDDYVTKPFSLEEVIARLRVILRHGRSASREVACARITVGDIELDENSHEVWKAGVEVLLSPTEFTLLRYFMLNTGKALSKTMILDHVWRYDFGGDAGVVESYVSYLRRKVDTTEPKMIHTLRGVGYVLRSSQLSQI